MKRWHYVALAAGVLAAAVYLYLHDGAALGNLLSSSGRTVMSASGTAQWRIVERPGDGFRVELPAEAKDAEVPAFNETGGTEPVHMLTANPNGDVTYAVTWADNPPVARVSRSVDRILYTARDGVLARTETTIVSESRGFHRDYPSLDMLARNTHGGLLEARLVLAENRLYMLLALFPDTSARRERDVHRLFSSFVPARPGGIPEAVPAAPQD